MLFVATYLLNNSLQHFFIGGNTGDAKKCLISSCIYEPYETQNFIKQRKFPLFFYLVDYKIVFK